MANITPKRLLRADEFAELCSVSIYTVWRWAREQKIDHVHVPGGSIRIPASEYDKVFLKAELVTNANECKRKLSRANDSS